MGTTILVIVAMLALAAGAAALIDSTRPSLRWLGTELA